MKNDSQDVDFEEMQEVGISMIMQGTMYTYLSQLVLSDDDMHCNKVFEAIMGSVKEIMLQFEQDYYKSDQEYCKRVYNLGPKTSALIDDYAEWQDVYKEMGLTLSENDATNNQ